MKVLLAIALSFMIAPFSVGIIHSQQTMPVGDDAVAEVNGALQELQMGLHTGFAQKRLARLGDEAASAIVRSHTLEEMRSESTAVAIAEAIGLSFASPSLIEAKSNGEPKVSTLLLTYLRVSVNTSKAQEAIKAASATLDRQSTKRTKP